MMNPAVTTIKSLWRLACVRIHSFPEVVDWIFSSLMVFSISDISNANKGELSSPSAWYLRRIWWASEVRLCSINQRGDSGTKIQSIIWNREETAWRALGKRHDQEPITEAVPNVTQAAISWPNAPVLFMIPTIWVRWEGCESSEIRIGQAVVWTVFPNPMRNRPATNIP